MAYNLYWFGFAGSNYPVLHSGKNKKKQGKKTSKNGLTKK